MQSGKGTQEEKIIQIDINLTRGWVPALAIVLTTATLVVYLALAGGSALAASQESTELVSEGMRQYYLGGSASGNAAKTACRAGYHMASFWEIADPSNLKYNKTYGLTRADSGKGPPSKIAGWVRTGYDNDTSTTIGHANCDGWGSNSSFDNGTGAMLPEVWTTGMEDLGVWELRDYPCNNPRPVWCIEN